MATIGRLHEDDIEPLVEDLWLPFALEMAEVGEFDALAADGVRENALAHRREQFDNDDRATFVASEDGKLVGYVSVEYRESPPVFARGDAGFVHGLYVVPDSRGTGLASDLFGRAREWADEQGCAHLELGVHPDNEPARSIYREWGFEPVREKLVRPL
jgi:GNAT superfamily N-acetyltransferase